MSQKPLYDDNVNVAAFLAASQVNSISQASGAIAANLLAGASENYLLTSGATALTTPTAAQLYAQLQQVMQSNGFGPNYNIPNNFQFYFRILNTNAGTLTLTAGTGVTFSGPATMATNTWRDYVVTLNAGLATFQSVGVGTGP